MCRCNGFLHTAIVIWSTFTMGVLIYALGRVHKTGQTWADMTEDYEVRVTQLPEIYGPVWLLIPPSCAKSKEATEVEALIQVAPSQTSVLSQTVDCEKLLSYPAPTLLQSIVALTWTSGGTSIEGLHRNRLEFFWYFSGLMIVNSIANWLLCIKSLLVWMEVVQTRSAHFLGNVRMVVLFMYEYFLMSSLALGMGQLFDTFEVDGGFVMMFIPAPGIAIYSLFLICCMIIDLFEFEEEFFHSVMPTCAGSFAMDFAVVFVIFALPAAPFFFYCAHFYYATAMTNGFAYEVALQAEMVGTTHVLGTVAQFLFTVSIVGYVIQMMQKALKVFQSVKARELPEWEHALLSLE